MTAHREITTATASAPSHRLSVLPRGAVTVTDGANLGDGIGVLDDLALGDVYQVGAGVEHVTLAVHAETGLEPLLVAPGGEVGRVGADLYLDCCCTFMSPDGTTLEALVLVEIARDGGSIGAIYLYPLAPMARRVDYALVAIARDAAKARFAETAFASFTSGTRITMATGAQVPVEALKVGDRVLTRDHGAQPIRWIGTKTVRAHGAFAPVRIAAGALHNANDLVVSPGHRLFVYQRSDRVRSGRAEVLIRAEHLLNGDTVTRTPGGFVDYFQLVFDRHEIVFAEGIAAETLLIDPRTRAALPRTQRDRRQDAPLPRVFELSEGRIDRARAADLLRQASVA